MLAKPLIERKRDGGRLSAPEWRALMAAYAADEIPDYQMAAFTMAVYCRGLDREETAALTDAMLHSGSSLSLGHLRAPRIDKHSTGGVGDKVSLVLAPLVGCLGVTVPMMSGRGLGHTGGTLDKLEAIPGFNTALTLEVVTRQLETLGCALFGQSDQIAPADRRLYALRDATATVPSVPLIASSIMSKKLAEDLTGLVLDVKVGAGGFLPDQPQALLLARTMVEIGADHGTPVVALLTAMDRPLGRACGNALEVEEAIQALRGEGPPDLMRVTYALGAEMLLVAGLVANRQEARRRMEVAISSGRAAEYFARVVDAQGGDPRVVDDPGLLPEAPECEVFCAGRDGMVVQIHPRRVGEGVVALGGGRQQITDRVDPTVGFVIAARPGDRVVRGTPLATVYARDAAGLAAGMAALSEAIELGEEAELPLPLISHRVTELGVEHYDDG